MIEPLQASPPRGFRLKCKKCGSKLPKIYRRSRKRKLITYGPCQKCK